MFHYSYIFATIGSQCISFESIRNSNLIFDDDNATCERFDLPNATLSNTLEINKSCIETSDVSEFNVFSSLN